MILTTNPQTWIFIWNVVRYLRAVQRVSAVQDKTKYKLIWCIFSVWSCKWAPSTWSPKDFQIVVQRLIIVDAIRLFVGWIL